MKAKCNDCGGPPREMSPEALAKGSQIREPGEHLCASCSSSRMILMRKVMALPNNLAEIKAKRMAPVRKTAVA